MLLINAPSDYIAERDYVIRVIFSEFLGLSHKKISGKHSDYNMKFCGIDNILLMPDVFFKQTDAQFLTEDSLPSNSLSRWDTRELSYDIPLVDHVVPVLYGKTQPVAHVEGQCIELSIDIFGSIYFMLTRYEETVIPDRDEHGRFPATASLAYKGGFLDRPIVDEYIEILWAAMKRLWPGLERKPRKFQMHVSHDVDSPSYYAYRPLKQILRESAGDVIKRNDPVKSFRGPWVWLNSRWRIHRWDPFNTFDWIMDVSEKYGLKSAFYFICGRTNPQYDGKYEIEHPAMRHLLRRINERGHEIGLHPSYNTYNDPDVIVNESKRLKRVCQEESIEQEEWGGRMHYLRWETPTTLYGWERAGMAYDSTLGYADHAGFRCGTCHEYPAFDPQRSKQLNLRIRPLIAMECSVMAEKYMGLGATQNAYNEFMKLKNACRKVGGNFTLLWHNSQFTTPEERDLYEAVLAG